MKSPTAQTARQAVPCLALAAALAGVPGCKGDTETAADKIEIVSGNNQMGEAGEVLAEPLEVRVEGPRVVDFLGRRAHRQPVEGVPVTFTIEAAFKKAADKPPADGGADGGGGAAAAEPAAAEDQVAEGPALPSHPTIQPLRPGSLDAGKRYVRKSVLTDATGVARAAVRLGARNGDWRIDASIDRKGEKVRFRAIAGVKKEILEPESVVGNKVPLRLRLSRLAEPGDPRSLRPLANHRIFYEVAGGPPGGVETAEIKEKDRQSKTDDDGWSEVEVTLGQKPGPYQILAEVEPKADEDPVRGILLQVVAMDWILVCWKLAGGILIFVIGVRLLGNGFLLAASPFLHLPTGSWSQSRFQGYLGGLAAGAVFESSSLVTSHLINLSNGGLLTAAGAIGLVLGANVGGTMLPQILSLDVGALSAPFLAAGTVLLLVPRRAGLTPWGWVFLGAGLTLAGWGLLQDAAEIASYSRKLKTEVLFGDVDASLSFPAYATRFIAYFSLGGLVAFILRTSNLIVVIAISLATRGILQPSTAVPLILGANLGSAAMVFVLSLRKRREAKRLGLANLAVQAAGCAGALLLSLVTARGQPLFLWLIDLVAPGKLISSPPVNVASHLAAAHTLYNLAAGAAFIFFPRPLFALVDAVLPPKAAAQEVKPYVLDRNLIAVPALALRQATEEVVYLTELCRKTIAEAFDSFRYNDLDLSDQVARRVETIAEMHREVSQYLVEVCENQLSRHDASRLEVLQTAAASLVRIGELGERLRDLTARRIEEKMAPDPEVDRDLNEVYDLVMAQFTNILSLLRQRDTKTEENAVKMVERLAKFSSRIEGQARQRIAEAGGPSNPMAIHLQTIVHQEVFNLLFRVAGHLAHIAQCMRILTPERF